MGKLIVISGPPAGGKDAVRREMVARGYEIIVTTTSRAERSDDLPGDYEYVSPPAFEKLVEEGVFGDLSPIHKGFRYGTRKSELLKCLQEDIVWRIDPTSAANAREIVGRAFESQPEIGEKIVANVVTFWVMPEDEDELANRLKQRDGHDRVLLEKALLQIRADMDFFEKNREKYDHVIINRRDQLLDAVDEIESEVNKEI